MTRNESKTDILIVGAGFAGAATAYHLARRGHDDAILVEQEPVPGVHSSGRNAAIVREHADDPSLAAMVREGAAELRRGRLAEFHRTGIVLMGMGDAEASRYFPRATGRGRWAPDDGTIDAAGLLRTYLDGRRVLYDTRVLGWSPKSDGLRVHTTRGEIDCRTLVNAAGPWAGVLGSLPLTPMNRHLFVSAELPWVRPDLPTVWDGRRGFYFRPESGGLLFCCCDETPAPPGDYVEDPRMLEELCEKLQRLQPDLGEVAIRWTWVGQRTFAPDRKFVVGRDPRDHRVFHVAALGGHGVTASYAIGRMAAELILDMHHECAAAFAASRLIGPTMDLPSDEVRVSAMRGRPQALAHGGVRR